MADLEQNATLPWAKHVRKILRNYNKKQFNYAGKKYGKWKEDVIVMQECDVLPL